MSEDKEFPKRLQKRLPTGFEEAVQSMDLEEIKKKIYESESHAYEIERAKEEDEKLTQAKEMVKEIQAPYKDAYDTEAAKIKFCFFVLESRGVSFSK